MQTNPRLTLQQKLRQQTSVPPVRLEYVIAVQRAVVDEYRSHGSASLLVGVMAALHGKADPLEILNVMSRFSALHKLLMEHELKEWVTIRTRQGVFVREMLAFMRAAARAPLRKTKRLHRYQFDKDTFLKVLLEECGVKGMA